MEVEKEYGFPTFGKIYSFIRDVITDDALIEIAKEETPDFNDYDKKRLQQQWLRYSKEISKQKEKVKDYTEYTLEDNPLFELAKSHLKKYKKYIFLLSDLFSSFCNNFYNEINKEKSARVYEKPLSTIAVLSINQSFITLLSSMNDNKIAKLLLYTMLNFINMDYGKIFDTIKTKSNNTVLLNQDKITHLVSTFKRTGKNISWNSLKMFIDSIPTVFSKDQQECFKTVLHTKFFYLQIKDALIKHFNFTDKEFTLFDNMIKSFLKSNKNLKDNINEQLNNFISPYIAIDDSLNETILKLYNEVFKEYKYKEEGSDNFIKRISKEITTVAPHFALFFIPWIKAYIYEALSLNDKSTVDYYHNKASESFEEAFCNYQYAGSGYLPLFIKMAFSFENHYADWTQARKTINQESNTITPLYMKAKMYYSFGYAIGLFSKKPSETFSETYHSQGFYKNYFPSICFINTKEALLRENKETLSNKGIETGKIEDFETEKETIYNYFKSLNTKSKRNDLIPRMKPLGRIDNNLDNQKRLYTPLSLCIQYGQRDERLWHLALEWLEDSENKIDIDKLCFNGSTALLEALTQYNFIQHAPYNHEDLEYKAKASLIRKVILKILEKATYLGATHYQKNIHPLQEAINCYDEEIIIKISEKISHNDFQNYIISSDECSPLYYLQNMKKYLMDKNNVLQNKKISDGIIWNNLPIEGALTTKEKQEKFSLYEDFYKDIVQILGKVDYKFKDEILNVYDKVAQYFIDRMDNVDSYKKRPNNTNQEITSLYYAAETDDINMVRLLLNKGANYNLRLGNANDFGCNYSPTFIYRLIIFSSYKTLYMFLTEYKDKAKKIMNKGQDEITPLVFFIHSFMEQKDIPINYFRDLVTLFIDCDSNLDENTEAGCARYYLEEQLHMYF